MATTLPSTLELLRRRYPTPCPRCGAKAGNECTDGYGRILPRHRNRPSGTV